MSEIARTSLLGPVVLAQTQMADSVEDKKDSQADKSKDKPKKAEKPKNQYKPWLPAVANIKTADKQAQKSPVQVIWPTPSIGYVAYTQETSGEKINIPIAYGKIETGFRASLSKKDSIQYVIGAKWGHPLTGKYNGTKEDAVTTYVETALDYTHNFSKGLAVGVSAEARWKVNKDFWYSPELAVSIPYTNTQIKLGPIWHQEVGRDSKPQPGARAGWHIVQPLFTLKEGSKSMNVFYMFEGEQDDSNNWWTNQIVGVKFRY